MKNIISFEKFVVAESKIEDLAKAKIEDLPKGKIFNDAKRIEGEFKKSKRTWHDVIGAFETNQNSAKPAIINVNDIHITQPNIQSNKVIAMLDHIKNLPPINVVEFENGEYAIYDGHHRLLAHWALGEKKIKVNLVKL